MPTAALRPCTGSPRCPALVAGGGRCPAHAVQREHDRGNFELRRLYRTARWRAVRALVLAEEPLCPECGAIGRAVPSVDVHHRVKAHGDLVLFFSRANLTALCHAHHSARTARGE